MGVRMCARARIMKLSNYKTARARATIFHSIMSYLGAQRVNMSIWKTVSETRGG